MFQFTPMIIVYGLSACLMLFLSLRTWHMRPARGAAAWSMTMLFCAINALGACLELAFAVPVYKLAMNRVIYVGATGCVFFWGIFAISYSGEERWLNRFTLGLMAIVPLSVLGLAFFAENHTLIYRAYDFIEVNGVLLGHVIAYGPVFWLWMIYSYLLLVSCWLLLLRFAVRSHTMFRSQTWMVILASAAPLLTYLLYMTGSNPIAPFDPTAIMLAFSGIVMLLAMTHYRFMDIVPVAHDLIYQNVRSGIMLIDLKGRVAGMNPTAERIVGYSADEVLGKEAEQAFPQHHAIVKQLQGIDDIKTEIAMSETGPYYEFQITPLRSHRGELAGRLVMFYDITERKRMEQQALDLAMERERVRLLQQFISHMSHDLRTPLATMKTSQYLLRKALDGQHSARLDVLDRQAERLNEMVNSMLTLLKLEENDLGSLLKVNVNDLIGYVIERHRTLAGEHGTQLRFSPEPDLPPILANREELDLALSNLLVNAIHYTPSGGEVTVMTLHDENGVTIAVRDTGDGIAEEDLPHIFDRFYRADDARGTGKGGFGLGLAIAKVIVDRHAGAIAVRSRSGEGSEFRVRLPLAKAI